MLALPGRPRKSGELKYVYGYNRQPGATDKHDDGQRGLHYNRGHSLVLGSRGREISERAVAIKRHRCVASNATPVCVASFAIDRAPPYYSARTNQRETGGLQITNVSFTRENIAPGNCGWYRRSVPAKG